MTAKAERGRRSEAAYQDLSDALNRLMDGRPKNQQLKKLVREKKLKITIKSVALEAKRSRTLIGSEDCRFPDIRARILKAGRGEDKPVTTVSRLAASYRAANMKLRSEIQVSQCQQALLLARLIEAERRATSAERELAAAKAHAPDQAAGEEEQHRGSTLVLKIPTSPRGGRKR